MDQHESNRAGEHERELPAVRQDRPRDERRREHRAHRRAHIEEAAGEPAFAGREPFGRRLHPGRIGRSFGKSQQRAQAEERLPAAREPVRHADEGPRDREDREPELQPHAVHDVAAERLQHDGELKGAEDPRILLRRDVQIFENSWRRHRERCSCQVVDDRPQHEQAHHPPAESPQLRQHVRVLTSAFSWSVLFGAMAPRLSIFEVVWRPFRMMTLAFRPAAGRRPRKQNETVDLR